MSETHLPHAPALFIDRAYCNVFEYVAVCCSVLQCVAARCSALQCIAVCCQRETRDTHLPHALPPLSTECVAVHCSALQCVATFYIVKCVAVRCSALQCRAVRHAATVCNTMQHTATHRRARHTFVPVTCGVATIRRLLKIIGLFCKRVL